MRFGPRFGSSLSRGAVISGSHQSRRDEHTNPDLGRSEPAIDAAVTEELRKFDRAGEPGLLETLTRVFQEHTATQLDELERLLDEGDAAGLERTAHALKGSCASIGARRMASLAAELHGQSRARTLASASGVIAGLREEFALASRALEQEKGRPPQGR